VTNKYLQFDIENAEVIENEDLDSQFATAKIRAFSSDKNLHNLVCSENVLQQTASTIYNKPILYTIDKSLQDFYTHVEPDKSLICGFVVPDSAEFTRLEDGRLSLNVFAKIWKKYSPKVIEFFKRDKDFKRVSVEMEVYEFGDRPDGLKDMLSFAYAGICILGDYVREASPGANMQLVSFSEDKKEYNEAYLAEFASKYDELDFSISPEIKKNAQEGLDLYKKHRRGGTSVSLAVARHLVNNEKVSPEKVRHIEKHFALHSGSDFSDKTGKEFIKWQLYGGTDGFNWSKKVVEFMNKIDQRKMSYFEQEGENIMPYSKIGDINPALKGIEPPISLAQANAIARQADAVGTSDKVNGWAVAIASFKKTHKVEDGKWVEKNKEEKMTEEEKKAEEEKMAAEESKKAEEAKKAEEEKMAAEESKKAEEAKKAEEEKKGKFSFAKFGNLVSYMDDEPDADDEETKMCKMAAEELKKGEEADFATVVSGMYAKMCKMMAKMSKMSEEKKMSEEEMSALKEFKMGVDKQQKQFAVDQTLQALDEKVIIPDEARKEMIADAEKYSFAEIETWKNACKAKSFDFALKGKKAKEEDKIITYALPFTLLPKPENSGSVWPAKKI
jgi:hypothetical protein